MTKNADSSPELSEGCPTETELLELLRADSAVSPWEDHVDRCSHCQEQLARLVESEPESGFLTLFRRSDAIHGPGVPGESEPSPSRVDVTLSIEGYRILREIGRGGMGVVYQAVDQDLGRVVAIKTLLAGYFSGPEQLARLTREAKALANLEHPNILRIHGSGQANGLPFLVLEFVDGANLSEWQREHRISCRDAVELLVQLSSAVEHAHRNGVIHRDLKPSNILVRNDDDQTGKLKVKIGDYGLARFIEGTTQTLSGSVLGTPCYMAPEQVSMSEPVGHQADIYSLGAIFYELLTGSPPFQANNPAEILRRITQEAPRAPRQVDRTIPSDLETVCLKCLARHPSRRYESANALTEDLQRWQDGFPIRARPVGWIEKTYRLASRHVVPSLTIASMALVVLIAMVAITASWRQTRSANQQLTQTIAELQYARYLDGIESAWQAWQTSDIARTHRLLDQLPAGHRHFEWHFLKAACDQSAFAQNMDASPDVRLAIAPGGHQVAFVHRDRRTVVVFDTDTMVSESVGTTDARVTCLAYDASGNKLLAGDKSGSATVWNCPDWSQSQRVHLSESPIRLLASHPDQGSIAWASATIGGCVDPQSLTVVKRYRGGAVVDLQFENSGETVVCARESGELSRWNLTDSSEHHCGSVGTESLRSIAVGGGGEIYAGGEGTQWYRLDASGERRFATLLQTGVNQCITLDHDRLVTAGRDGTLRLWDSRQGEELRAFRGHVGEVTSVAWNPVRSQIVSVGQDGTLRFWNLAVDSRAVTIKKIGEGYTCIDVSQSQQEAIGVGSEGRVFIFDGDLNRRAEQSGPAAGAVKALRWSPDGRWIAAAFERLNHEIAVLSCNGLREQTRIRSLRTIADLAFDPSSSNVFCRSSSASVQSWNVETGEKGQRIGDEPSLTYSVDVASDGELLAAKTDHSQLRIWDLATKKLLAERSFTPVISRVRFSPDGKLLAVGARDGVVRLFSAPDWRVVQTMADAPNIVGHLAFSPDGSRLAAGQTDGRIRLWDLKAQRRVMSYDVGCGGITGLGFSSTGARLYFSTGDGFLGVLRAERHSFD